MYKNSRHTILFPLLLAVGVVAGILLGQYLGRSKVEQQFRGVVSRLATPEGKLGYTLSLIEREYIDSLSVDSLTELVLPKLISELDPHSVYIPASEMQAVNEPLEGEFDGIGVVFNMATDTVVVLNVVPSGPSRKAGVQPGDRIIRIDDSLVAGQKIPQDQIVKRLRGKRGTSVRLSLERRGIDHPVEVTVVRDAIPVKSIEAAFMLTSKLGYVKLSQFSRTSYAELMTALRRLRREGMQGLIFDLRGNAGGYLDQAILIANEFLPAERLIVYTEDRHGARMHEYSNGNGRSTDLGLAILIDEGSASSSEILAGAVQDNDRGTILGRRSFGKGLVQRQIPYSDGSALRLTTARYYTPTGRSIQKPYTRGDGESYQMELWERYAHHEHFSADSIRFADSLKFTTPGGRVVYGGGGIMPDRFIPADTTDVTPWFIQVTGRNILYRYTMEYADRHRTQLNEIESLAALQRLLDGDNRLVEDFLEYARQKGVKPNRTQIARSRHLVEAQLRAYIGRNTTLEDNAFYYNIYPIDNVLVEAVELLNRELASRSAAPAADSLNNPPSRSWKTENIETIEFRQ
ncbi:MAG: S41 family peptidase [Rikenellaceae bacterium]|nr:S41 family peptidase [Rikenellaceae bacterium]